MSLLYNIIVFCTTLIILITAQAPKPCPRENESINGVGTVLFTAADKYKQCWSPEEIALLSSRMILEDLLPDVSVLNIDCNEFVEDVVGYFRLLIEVVKKATHGRKKRIILLALTDLVGGYLQYAVLPITRYAFYAGVVDYTRIEKLIQLFEEIKWFLRTNGQGWPKPMKITSSLNIETINFEVESPKGKSCCEQLIFTETERRSAGDKSKSIMIRSNIVFPLPFFDSKVRPTSIAIPFKKFPLRNIESRKASHILLKFFVGAVQCLKEKNTDKDTQSKFLNTFFGWVRKQVLPKLDDDKFYSAFGGILRVEESLKIMGAVEFNNLTCLPDGDQEMVVPMAGGSKKHVSSTLILTIMLIIIILWFIIGTAFICYRMRKHKKKPDGGPEPPPKLESSTSISDHSKWSIFSKSKSETKSEQESVKKCKCSSKTTQYSSSYTSDFDVEENAKKRKHRKDKSVTICYPPFMVPYIEKHKPAVLETKTTMKKLPSIEEISEITLENKSQRLKKEDSGKELSKKQNQKHSSKKGHSDDFNTSGSGSTTNSKYVKKKRPCDKLPEVDECWCDNQEKNISIFHPRDQSTPIKEAKNSALKQPSIDKTLNSEQQRKSSLTLSFKEDEEEIDQGTTKYYSMKHPSDQMKRLSKEISDISHNQPHARSSRSRDQELFVTLPLTEELSPDNSPQEDVTGDESVLDKVSPHTYACHSSLTGDYANRTADGKPHIFGYDFQTSSSSELSEEETDLKTSTSK